MSEPACTLPPLAEPYRTALKETIAYIFGSFEPAGIVASGTIIRGNPAPTSDLDVYVIHRKPWRQRLQKFFNGVPAELFVNPPEQIEGYFEDERIDGRPITAHMLATGFVVYDPDGLVERLRARATEVLENGPPVSAASLLARRYGVATLFEDALDIADIDPEMCQALLAGAVEDAVRYRFWAASQWQPRHKELLRALFHLDPSLAQQAREFYLATHAHDRIRLAREIVRRSVGEIGFFEWESSVE
jgi:predicted nucleotidyltransferase